MIQLVIFDMAGTAVSEDNIVYKTILAALLDAGHDFTLDEVLEYCAGKEKRQAIIDILSHSNASATIDEVDAIHSDFRKRLDTAYEEADLQLFDSVNAIIQVLKAHDIRVAFNTGYKRERALQILKKCEVVIGDQIDVLVAADDVARGRPHSDMILKICDELKVDPSQTVKIGDSAIDIEEGKNAKVALTIGITTGAQTRDQIAIADPDHIIDDMMDLRSIVITE